MTSCSPIEYVEQSWLAITVHAIKDLYLEHITFCNRSCDLYFGSWPASAIAKQIPYKYKFIVTDVEHVFFVDGPHYVAAKDHLESVKSVLQIRAVKDVYITQTQAIVIEFKGGYSLYIESPALAILSDA